MPAELYLPPPQLAVHVPVDGSKLPDGQERQSLAFGPLQVWQLPSHASHVLVEFFPY